MENQEYVFIPTGDQPTVGNIKKGLGISIGILALVCIGTALYSEPEHKIYSLFAFDILSLIAIFLRITGKYIQNIRIDPIAGMLYSAYLTISGREGITMIDIKDANYSYEFSASKGYQGYIFTIKDKMTRLQLRETRSASNRKHKNRFLRSQLHQINEIILQVKSKSQ